MCVGSVVCVGLYVWYGASTGDVCAWVYGVVCIVGIYV